MKAKTPSILIALALTCGIAQARLGETREQCAARYGQEVPSGVPNVILYRKAPLLIGCQFSEAGVCEAITYRNEEENVLEVPIALTEAQLEALLVVNGAGVAWTKDTTGSGGVRSRIWRTPTLIAAYDIIDHLLVVMTQAAAVREGQEKAQKEKEALQGF